MVSNKESSILAEPQAHHRFLIWQTSPRLIPSNIPNRLLQHIFILPIHLQPSIPLTAPTTNKLIAPILLGRRVGAPEPLEQLGAGGAAGHVDGLKLELRGDGELPGWRVGFEHVDLRMQRWEEVVVSGLAADAARRVCKLGGGHVSVDVGMDLALARDGIVHAVWLLRVVLGLGSVVGGLRVALGIWHRVDVLPSSRVSYAGIEVILRHRAVGITRSSTLLNVGSVLAGCWGSVRGEVGTITS